eukprot:UN09323
MIPSCYTNIIKQKSIQLQLNNKLHKSTKGKGKQKKKC